MVFHDFSVDSAMIQLKELGTRRLLECKMLEIATLLGFETYILGNISQGGV
jgi:hypothetical protein